MFSLPDPCLIGHPTRIYRAAAPRSLAQPLTACEPEKLQALGKLARKTLHVVLPVDLRHHRLSGPFRRRAMSSLAQCQREREAPIAPAEARPKAPPYMNKQVLMHACMHTYIHSFITYIIDTCRHTGRTTADTRRPTAEGIHATTE